MQVRPIQESDLPAYESLCAAEGTLFNSTAWLGLFGTRVVRAGVFADGGELVGGFAYCRETRMGIPFLRNPNFTPTCGPLARIRAQGPVAVLEARREIAEAMAEHLSGLSYGVLLLRLDRRWEDALPFYWRGFKVVPGYTYLIDLGEPWDRIMENMASVRRRNITRALKDGLEVRKVDDLQIVKDLVHNSFNRQAKGINDSDLDAVLFRYAKPENSYAYAVYRAATPIAAAFVVHDQRTAYYLLGGYRLDEKHHGAGPLAMCEAIRHAQRLGLRIFDFEGSIIPPIERYIRGFGGRLTPYFSISRAWLPLEMLLKLKDRRHF